MRRKDFFLVLLVLIFTLNSYVVFADYYKVDLGLTVSSSIFTLGERIELKGKVLQSQFFNNGTMISNNTPVNNSTITLSILNQSNSTVSNYSLNTTTLGEFYTRSDTKTTDVLVNAPTDNGTYTLTVLYVDNNSTNWTTKIEIEVLNESVDSLAVSTNRASYESSETIIITVEAIRSVGDRLTFVPNVSISGNLRDNNKTSISNFSCITSETGKCRISTPAPTTYGQYTVEVNNYKAFSSFEVRQFEVNMYMTDEFGQSIKHSFSTGDQAGVQLEVLTNSTTETYSFTGEIRDSNGNFITLINTTDLNNNNSYTNQFVFTISSLNYSFGGYFASVNVTKTGDVTVAATTSFTITDWDIAFQKSTKLSGFQYSYSSFANTTLFFEIYPTWRANGTLIQNINLTSFNITIKNNLNDVQALPNVTYNATCGTGGCYEFNLTSPINSGEYSLETELSFSGDTRKSSRIINVISGYVSAQPTNLDGEIKELFGINEFIYLSLEKRNQNNTIVNITSVDSILITYMNGTDLNYTSKNNFSDVNGTNSIYEWAMNNSSQTVKLDVPATGGVYDIILSVENSTLVASTRFVVNPYDVCVSAKDTGGTVSTNDYYTYQFKTSDTIYFEVKVKQANNPAGRASFLNTSANGTNTTGLGTACTIDTTTDQVVNNASITIEKVKNVRTGEIVTLNSTSVCNVDDDQGGYTCTVQPLDNWDGGSYSVQFKATSQDGSTEDIAFGNFEARAFYIYAHSSTYQNDPTSDISLTVNMYEAGDNWWGNYGASGLTGTVTVERVEYQGRSGEWLWPPINYDYNTSAINSTTVTNGQGTLTMPASYAPDGSWKTGYYRAILKGTDNGGTTDYGYAWFGIRLFDTYASPVDCTGSTCSSKYYLSTKENVSLYVRISKAGQYNTGGGVDLGGNLSITVKKIQDCRRWPCTDLNSSEYNSTTLTINQSSPHYWSSPDSSYLINLTPTTDNKRWKSGSYNVVLNVNGSDTGQGWFQAIAFYIESRPTDDTGNNWKNSIKPNETRHFNITTVKSRKSSSYYSGYNISDYINTTITGASLRSYDGTTNIQTEYTYPSDLNITPLNITGNALVNVTYNTGNWPTGYYWGELTMKDNENQSNTGYLWFQVRPFRVAASTNQYTVDDDACVNGTINIYEPDYRTSTVLNSNYSIVSVTERIWSGSSYSLTTYTNYTPSSVFNGSTNLEICPNNGGSWPSSSYSGYHSLTVLVKDNETNDTESGWLSFRGIPFSISFGSISGGTNQLTGSDITVPITIAKATSGASAAGNITSISQWRSDTSRGSYEYYNFSIGSNCSSTTSSSCMINGTDTVTISAPADGWKSGYNYLNAVFTKTNDPTVTINSYSSIYFYGKSAYSAWFENRDDIGNWKYNYAPDENLTIQISNIRDINDNTVDVNVTNVQYAVPGSNCWSEYCRTYSNANWQLVGGSGTGNQSSNGNATIRIYQSTNWSRGHHYFKVSVSGVNGTGTITGGNVFVRDLTAPLVNITQPINNETVNNSSIILTATTNEPSTCYIYMNNYDYYSAQRCGALATNASNNSSTATEPNLGASCNDSIYTGATYYSIYISKDYYSYYANSSHSFWSTGSYVSTGGTTHSYTLDISNLPTQHYGVYFYCEDADSNDARDGVTILVNTTSGGGTSSSAVSTAINVSLESPATSATTISNPITFNYSFTGPTTANCSLYSNFTGTWHENLTSNNVSNGSTLSFNQNVSDGNYIWNVYCIDTSNSSNTGWGTSNYSLTQSISLSTALNVSLTAPTNNSSGISNPVSFNYSYSNAVNANCSLYSNFTGTWHENLTSVNVSNVTNTFSQNISNGTYIWNVYCIDTTNSSNNAWGSNNFTLHLNTNISNQTTTSLISPTNNSTVSTSNPVVFNYSLQGPNANCSLYGNWSGGWHLNVTTNTLGAADRHRINVNLANGTYIWNMYCADVTNSSNSDWGDPNWNWTFTFNGG